VQIASFEPDQRGKLDDIARLWKTNPKWDAITIDGYAAAHGRPEPETVQQAQRSAESARTYLVRHGVPAESVIVIGHVASGSAHATRIDLSVTTCDDVTIACRKP
jgi:outer membrane protein OmpA-like peptidoglycan-associated protein